MRSAPEICAGDLTLSRTEIICFSRNLTGSGREDIPGSCLPNHEKVATHSAKTSPRLLSLRLPPAGMRAGAVEGDSQRRHARHVGGVEEWTRCLQRAGRLRRNKRREQRAGERAANAPLSVPKSQEKATWAMRSVASFWQRAGICSDEQGQGEEWDEAQGVMCGRVEKAQPIERHKSYTWILGALERTSEGEKGSCLDRGELPLRRRPADGRFESSKDSSLDERGRRAGGVQQQGRAERLCAHTGSET